MIVFSFIDRQIAVTKKQSDELKSLSKQMQLEHPRGRFRYYQGLLTQLEWKLFAVSAFFTPMSHFEAQVKEKHIRKAMQRCREEMDNALLMNW
jgi:hypothetical protein